MATEPQTVTDTASLPGRPTRVRHVVLGLTVVAYMITYMDRLVIASAAPEIQREFGFSEITMGWIFSAFYWAYALFQVPGGWLGDRIGPRKALALIVGWWSVFTSLTVAAWNLSSLLVFRFLFGAGEAGAFPIATRSLSRWMLPTERGFAQGVTHAGSRLGAAITPPLVVALIVTLGWRAPFLIFGAVGLIWAVVWFVWYRDTPDEHKSCNEAERQLIRESIGAPRSRTSVSVPWRKILKHPTIWYLCGMYFCYGYSLALYLNWFPTYLVRHRGFNLAEMGFYASLPLLAGVLGDLLGGWGSDALLRRSGNLKTSRQLVAIGGFALAGLSIIPAALTADPLMSVWFTCLALFGLEITVGVSWAVPLDIGGDFAGSTSAVMNTFGNLGGALSAMLVGYLVAFHGWNLPFLVASALCLAAAALFLKIDAGRRIFV